MVKPKWTTDYAVMEVKEMFRDFLSGLPYKTDVSFSGTRLTAWIEWAWGVSGRIEVELLPLEITLSWASTGRDIPAALAVINVYTRLLNAAAMIETRLREVEITREDDAA